MLFRTHIHGLTVCDILVLVITLMFFYFHNTCTFQISVKYGERVRIAIVRDPHLQRVCKAILNKSGPAAIVRALNVDPYRDAFFICICKKLRGEIASMCRQNQTFLRPVSLDPANFSWKHLWEKIGQISPILQKLLETCNEIIIILIFILYIHTLVPSIKIDIKIDK